LHVAQLPVARTPRTLRRRAGEAARGAHSPRAVDSGERRHIGRRVDGGGGRMIRSASIAVLGGGVSGLTFASRMHELGFSRVVVFEREPRVGGKPCTVDIDGRPHDLGATMGVPLDYRRVLRISRKMGIKTTRFPDERHYSLALGRAVPLN